MEFHKTLDQSDNLVRVVNMSNNTTIDTEQQPNTTSNNSTTKLGGSGGGGGTSGHPHMADIANLLVSASSSSSFNNNNNHDHDHTQQQHRITHSDSHLLEHSIDYLHKFQTAIMDANHTHLPSICEFITHAVNRPYEQDTKRWKLRMFTREDIWVCLLLCLGYYTTIFSRTPYYSVSPNLRDADKALQYNAEKHGKVVLVNTIMSALGKVIFGFILDEIPSRKSLMVFRTISALCMLGLANIHQISNDPDELLTMLLIFVGINAAFQSCIFALEVKFVRHHYSAVQYGRILLFLGIASRLGSITNSLMIAGLFSSGYTWMDAIIIDMSLTLSGVVFVIMLYGFPHPRTDIIPEEFLENKGKWNAPPPPRRSNIFRKLNCVELVHHFSNVIHHWRHWFGDRQFLLMVIWQASMEVLTDAFEPFIPLAASATFGTSKFENASFTVALNFGYIISFAIAGQFIQKLMRPAQANAVLLMMVSAVIVYILLLILFSVEEHVRPRPIHFSGAVILIFCVGVCLGYPVDVVVPAFCIHFGGDRVALVSLTIQLIGLGFASVFAVIVGRVHHLGWSVVIGILIFFSILAVVSLFFFDYFELLEKKRRKLRLKAFVKTHDIHGTLGLEKQISMKSGGDSQTFHDLASELFHHPSQRVQEIAHLFTEDMSHRYHELIVSNQCATAITSSIVLVFTIVFIVYVVFTTDPSSVALPFADGGSFNGTV
jgi:sugar phosphate permease